MFLWALLHPEVAQAVRAHPALAGAAVGESLRLEPAAAAVARYATRDLSLGGCDIVSGDFVRVSITGANRDPAVFPCPDAFDIHRSNRAPTSPSRRVRTSASPWISRGWRLGSRSSPSGRPCPT